MSAIWLKLTALLCVSGAALSDSEGHGVVWRQLGGNFTIRCRADASRSSEFLNVEWGLSKEKILVKENNKTKKTISEKFVKRMELNGMFPNLDITITNLSSEDTGPYWCIYTMYNQETYKMTDFIGEGSRLLVVKAGAAPQCKAAPRKDLVVVSVVVFSAILVIIFGALIIFIFKKKLLHRAMKPQRVATNDVYEDMRGTLRR